MSIVIVNWNSGRFLHDCLASITAAALPDTVHLDSVVVVDNASSDGSADGLDGFLGSLNLKVKRNVANVGFAAACNQGAALSRSSFVLFLNPDTQLHARSLEIPLMYMLSQSHGRVGITGIQLIDDQGAVARSCARFPRARQFLWQALGVDRLLPRIGHSMQEWDHGATRHVDQVIGAFFLVRRTLFDQLGGFDEQFFVYFEEVDFAFRARQVGWSSVYLAEATAYHAGGGTSRQIKGRRLFYSLRSRLLYGRKHFSLSERALLIVASLIVEPTARIAQSLVRRSLDDLRNVFEAYWLLIVDSSRGSTRF